MPLQQRLMRLLRPRLMRRALLISLLIAGSAPIALAQSSQGSGRPLISTATSTSGSSARTNQDDPTAKALEQAVNRLAVAEEKNRLLEEQIKAKDDRIAAKDERILNLTERIELMKANRVDTTTVITGDARMLQACEQQLARSDAEIARLRNPPFFKRLFSSESLMGFGVGYGAASLRK